nr:hypothetical protein BaRGS_011943 [Batillaria attramentaria]
MEVSILASGLVCTLYTALGGIRAVVWTDAFQVVIILAGYLTLIVMGTRSVGGWSVVMDRAREGDRFTWDLDMRPDPFIRHTFWTLFVGGTFASLVVYASNQAMLQRYLSVRNLKTARMTILLHLPFSEVFLALGMLSGLVMYAFYYGCDPLKLGIVSKADQLMPLFVLQTLGDYPGLPGLFVACIYSAALSTISSGVNSLAAVTLEDFLRPWVDRVAGGRRSSRLHSVVTVVLALVYGLATIGLAYLAGILDSTILQIAISILGMVGGPLLGLLIVGIFFPCINSWVSGFNRNKEIDRRTYYDITTCFRRKVAKVPHTVHYVWCGSKQLRFQHYLGLLSAVRVLQPVKLVFHYTELPVEDDYNNWHPCGSRGLLGTILDLLWIDGGVYIGENIILTRRPQVEDNLSLWFAFSNTSSDLTRGVIYSTRGFDEGRKQGYTKDIKSSKPSCVSKESYNINRNAKCIVLSDDNLYPRDIMYAETPFAEMARWLFYGKRAVPRVQRNKGEHTPRIAHFIWFESVEDFYRGDFSFAYFLSILSALYVGGFHSVYVHGVTSPEGYWWEELQGENVTFVPTQQPETVFQHPIGYASRTQASNLLRLVLLYKYGGVYQDNDVYWVRRVPDSLLTYPFVASLDWPRRAAGFENLKALRGSTGMYAKIGRKILWKSGRADMLG